MNQNGECRPCFVSWSTRPKWSTNKWKIRDELISSVSPYTGFCGASYYYMCLMKNARLSGGYSIQYKSMEDAVEVMTTLKPDCASRSLRTRSLSGESRWRQTSFLHVSFYPRQDSLLGRLQRTSRNVLLVSNVCHLSPRTCLRKQFKDSMTDIWCSIGFGSNESGSEFGSGNIPGVEVCTLISLLSNNTSRWEFNLTGRMDG